jgi:hypothetical protein
MKIEVKNKMYVIIENIEEYLDTRIVKKESGELFFDSIEEGLEYLQTPFQESPML